MGMKIDFLPERLNDGNDPGIQIFSGDGLKVFLKSFHCTQAEGTLKLTIVLEEDAKHFGDDEDPLAQLQGGLNRYPCVYALRLISSAGIFHRRRSRRRCPSPQK